MKQGNNESGRYNRWTGYVVIVIVDTLRQCFPPLQSLDLLRCNRYLSENKK